MADDADYRDVRVKSRQDQEKNLFFTDFLWDKLHSLDNLIEKIND